MVATSIANGAKTRAILRRRGGGSAAFSLFAAFEEWSSWSLSSSASYGQKRLSSLVPTTAGVVASGKESPQRWSPPRKETTSRRFWRRGREGREGFLPFGRTKRQQTRSIFIQTQTTPNPSSLMFLPGKPVLPSSKAPADDRNDDGNGTKYSVNFSNAREALERNSPLATRLFQIDGVMGVFFGADFVTVTKSERHDWEVLKAEVFAKIMDFYASGEDAVRLSSSSSKNGEGGEEMDEDNPNRILETDLETVAMIKELLETRIKPAVAEDGGDIAFKKFDEEEGVVYVQLRGACDGCPSSTVTLKSGIENMLMHYVPEVKGVMPWEGNKEMDLLDMADLMRGR